jgi:hypothetical protein
VLAVALLAFTGLLIQTLARAGSRLSPRLQALEDDAPP